MTSRWTAAWDSGKRSGWENHNSKEKGNHVPYGQLEKTSENCLFQHYTFIVYI